MAMPVESNQRWGVIFAGLNAACVLAMLGLALIPGAFATSGDMRVSNTEIRNLKRSKVSRDSFEKLSGTVGSNKQRIADLERNQRAVQTNQQALLEGQAGIRAQLESMDKRLERMSHSSKSQ